jgi:carbonic anhydrase/acetyltransferase-like protein (isoleucine patch superfamily)
MVLRRYGDKKPSLGANVYVDESAVLIGDVRLRDKASVWPGVILRADDASVDIGVGSAVMDTAFVEAPKARPVTVGEHCIVSHSAVLHGCRIGDECLIGIGSIVLDGVSIGERSVLAAGSLVTPGTKIPPDSFVIGVPARVTRATTQGDLKWLRDELVILEEKAGRYRAQAETLRA